MNDIERRALARGIRMAMNAELESIRDVLRRVLHRIEVLETAQLSQPYTQAQWQSATLTGRRKPSTRRPKENSHAGHIR